MHVYAGMFAIAFATLALEIIFSRLLSVITWYHLVFFAVSTAMLGMTAGATRVYLQPDRYRKDQLHRRLSGDCLGFAISIPVSLSLLCLLPLELQPFATSYIAFLFATVACALPFYFSGVVVTVVLTKYPLPIGRLYACDLVGASLGCLFVLAGLEVLDAPSLILLCSSIGILASLCFAAKNTSTAAARIKIILLVVSVLVSFVNAFNHYGLRPLFVKGRIIRPYSYLMERWNSYSRVMVYKGRERIPQYWGPSPKAPTDPIQQYFMNIDGEAGTSMRKFETKKDIEHLRYDVTNIGYFLGREGPACIIGVGGGRDLQSALLFGQKPVLGVEVNPIFIDLLTGEFADFAGLAGHEDVELVVDDARSYLSRTKDRFSVIQMSLIDTWAATGAGAFSLTENALYTVQAWKVFLGRLAEDGFFTVSRWHNPHNLGESGRVVSLAVATLLELGVEDPSRHIAMITTDRISTLLLSPQPFSDLDLDVLRSRCEEMEYQTMHLPGKLPEHADLRELLSASSMPELLAVARGKLLNYEPPTDESPYFFNMLKLGNLNFVRENHEGVLKGNLDATKTLLVLLLSLLVITFATIVVPLLIKSRGGDFPKGPRRAFVAGALYFSLIGAGFMLVEIGLIQKLSVFLGHPVYALGILLFTLILSTGLGSYLSESVSLERRGPTVFIPLATVLTIVLLRFLVDTVMAKMITYSMSAKIAASIVMLFPLGIVMGCFFPLGMRMARASLSAETPWFWALNGILGVLCSALAVFVSIYASISLNFYLSALCYLGCLFCAGILQKSFATAQATANLNNDGETVSPSVA